MTEYIPRPDGREVVPLRAVDAATEVSLDEARPRPRTST